MGLKEYLEYQAYAFNRAKDPDKNPEEFGHFFGDNVEAFENMYQEEKSYWEKKVEEEKRGSIFLDGFNKWKEEKEILNEDY